MAQTSVKLPPGFVLDEDEPTSGLPEGFVLDSQTAKPAMPTEAQPEPQESAAWRFAKGAMSTLDPRPIFNLAKESNFNPVVMAAKTALGAGKAALAQGGKAKQAYDEGRYSEAFGHGLASVIPGVGPWAANIGEQMGSGDIAGGAGQLTAALLPTGKRALTAAVPSLARKAEGALKQSAAKSMYKALDPGPAAQKVMAERVAPGLVERGVSALTQRGLERKIAKGAEKAGKALEQGYQNVPQGTVVNTAPIKSAIEKSKYDSKSVISGANGPVVVEPTFVKAADDLIQIVDEFGPQVSFDSLVKLRQRWDQTVAKGKGFTQPDLGVALDVKRDAVAAIRKELASASPEVAKLNAEYSFWKQADDVISSTILRKKGQGPTLTEQVATGAGIAAGASGGLATALSAGAALKMATRMFRSPGWKTVSAKQKNRLANAIMSGNPTLTGAVLAQIAAQVNQSQEE